MAGRPIKQGLDFFYLDVGFFRDLKVRKIVKACGSNAYAVIICLLCNIYRERGYYILWDNDLPFVIADEVGVSEGCVQEVITKAIQVGFFDQKKFSEHQVLTSCGIQKRYFDATYKRKEIDRREEYIINSAEMVINSGINSINDVRNEQTKTKTKTKTKTSISIVQDNNSTREEEGIEFRERENFYKIFFFRNANNPEGEVNKFYNHYQAVNWMRKGEKITDRAAVAQNWEIREAGRFPEQFLRIWDELYGQLEKVAAARPELGRMLTEIHKAEIKDGVMTLTVTARLQSYIERTGRLLRPILIREQLRLEYIIK